MEKPPVADQTRLVDWTSLPADVLGKWLTSCAGQRECKAAFGTCKAFAKAVLVAASKVQVRIRLHQHSGEGSMRALAAVLRWAGPACNDLHISLVGETRPFRPVRVSLNGISECIEALHQVSGPIQSVTRLEFQMALLDCPAQARIAQVFPNLQHIEFKEACYYAVEGPLPLTGCEQLSSLEILYEPAPAQDDNICPIYDMPWIQQMAKLPTLSSLALHGAAVNDLALATLQTAVRTQLTKLTLGSGVQPTAMLAISACTRLRSLHLHRCATQHLDMMTSTLILLQELSISVVDYELGGNSLASSLVQLPHLTSVDVPSFGQLQESYADAPCKWKRISIGLATSHLLSRLPLHALQQPLALAELRLDFVPGAEGMVTVADVQAAVDNLARSGQGIQQRMSNGQCFNIRFNSDQPASEVAALLRAAGPLLAQNTDEFGLEGLEMTVDVVLALKEVMPAQITSLMLTDCNVHPRAWVSLGQSFWQLTQLVVPTGYGPITWFTPAAVMGFFMAAHAQALLSPGRGEGMPRVPKLSVDAEMMDEELWGEMEQQQAIGDMLQQLGLPQDQFSVDM